MRLALLLGIAGFVAFNLTTAAAESSVSQKKASHHARHVKAKPVDPYAALEPYRSMDFKGAYPGDYALRRSLGECVEDLGYGRFVSCEGRW